MAILTDLYSDSARDLSTELLKLNLPVSYLDKDTANPEAELFILEDTATKRLNFKGLCKKAKVIVLVGEDNSELIKEYFDDGAYDVFAMPIKPNEILYKCKRALYEESLKNSFFDSNLELKLIGLTFKQIQIYRLLEHAGEKGMNRTEFESKLWNGENVHSKTLDVHLCNLRKRLKIRNQEIKINKEKRWHLCSM